MPPEASVPHTRRDAVLLRLREEIASGALAPGEAIKDAALAKRFGISITPVREALKQLEVEGLIEMPPNRAKRVAPLTKRSAIELAEVLRSLMTAAYELVAARLTPADLTAMHAANRAYADAAAHADMRAAFRATQRFTDVLLRATGNRELHRLHALTLSRLERLALLRFQGHLPIQGTELHAPILAALAAGDPAEATRLHRQAFATFLEALHALPDDPA